MPQHIEEREKYDDIFFFIPSYFKVMKTIKKHTR